MLYYIHGYQSNPKSTKGTFFQKELHAKAIHYRTGKPENIIIAECLKKIGQEIENDPNVILIGSSLGGFLAAATALDHPNVHILILLNPAIPPPSLDINTLTDMPKHILKDMINPKLFHQKLKTEIIILRGTEDTVVPDYWIMEFAKAQQTKIQLFHDDHQFSRNLEKLPQIINDILQKK